MNHTIKGILIVAAIASMLIVGATMVPIMQNSFASKKSDFKKAERDPNINTNINTNINSADSTSSSTAAADNTNNINNTACAVAVSTCPKGNTPTPTPTLTLPNSGVLGIIKVCFPACPDVIFSIKVTGNNPQPSSFTLSIPSHKSQAVTLGPGTFTVTEAHVAGFNPPSFANNCKQVTGDSATGTIRAGQTLTCVITNIRGG
jgi:cytoskeletal protein RodZ